MVGNKKYFKAIVLDFWPKFLLCEKWGEMGIFGPKINIFEFFSKFVNKVFLKFYLMTGIKKTVKEIIFMIIPKMNEMGHF